MRKVTLIAIALLAVSTFAFAGEAQIAKGKVLDVSGNVVTVAGENGEEFGDRRLLEILLRHRDEPLGALVHRVHGALDRWRAGAPIPDDFTLVLARVN